MGTVYTVDTSIPPHTHVESTCTTKTSVTFTNTNVVPKGGSSANYFLSVEYIRDDGAYIGNSVAPNTSITISTCFYYDTVVVSVPASGLANPNSYTLSAGTTC